jgi:cytoskeletal protein RodZ
MDIGSELRLARKRAGLSIDDLTQRTKIQPHKIEALENNAFDQLPEGIYLDGIVRAYATEVGLDASDTVELARKAAGVTPIEMVETTGDEVDSFPDEKVFAREVREPAAAPVAHSDLDTIHRARADDYAEPAAQTPVVLDARVRPRTRVLIPALALIAAAGWGAFLYERSRPINQAAASGVPALSERDAPPGPTATNTDAQPAASSTAAPVAAGAPEPDAEAPTRSDPARAAAGSHQPADTRPIPPVEAPRVVNAPPAEAPPVAAANVERPRSPDVDPARAASIAGTWTLTTRVESSSYKSYNGLRLGYQLELQQEGHHITGTGRKVSENGTPLASTSQTPITVEGDLDGNRMQLTFSERGARRASGGSFQLHISDAGVMRGRFTSDAARSAGTAELRRTTPR